ncbi:DUF642 domain-containing protein [Ideonella sp. DXS22W]|uniref:DUF642 domain-containing protein n=1 Tax=Pseudaquabacterium inlustre TaxID=2984192 RepID=A0ABU9CA11_9BURK
MTIRSSAKLCVLGLALLAAVGAAQATLVTNGGFEDPSLDLSSGYKYLADNPTNYDSTTLKGWRVTDDGDGERSYAMDGAVYRPRGVVIPEGHVAIFMNQGTSLATDISLVAGQRYQVSFFAQYCVTCKTTGPLEVTIGTDTFQFVLPAGYQSFDYVAKSTNPATQLSFTNTSPTDDYRGITLDDVQVNILPTSTVDEPPTAMMVLMAGALLLVKRRKKQQAKPAVAA